MIKGMEMTINKVAGRSRRNSLGEGETGTNLSKVIRKTISQVTV
jgi:hypothetical protein